MLQSHQSNISTDSIDILSKLLLKRARDFSSASSSAIPCLQKINAPQFESVIALAQSNHVLIRAMEVYRSLAVDWNDPQRIRRVEETIFAEKSRISNATSYLRTICDTFAEAGLDVTVIKTLDHWPDFGSDIDLYTNTDPNSVCALMQRQFDATIAARSWGDRLAGKWNFVIPGLPEAVEIHMGRLGQTGENLTLAANLPLRSRLMQYDEYSFPVPSASDRIMVSTLQRMYRHFYFRLCDIVDSAWLVSSGELDCEDLRRSAQDCGIWEGVATYLVLVSDYVSRYTGYASVALPNFVQQAARFDGSVMYSEGGFLRVPIMPQSAGLYRSLLFDSLRKGEMTSSARLGLLPWLATAAAIGYKVTGSDKGIW